MKDNKVIYWSEAKEYLVAEIDKASLETIKSIDPKTLPECKMENMLAGIFSLADSLKAALADEDQDDENG